MYLAECLDADSRGKGTGMFQLLLTIGLAFAAVIGLVVTGWVGDSDKILKPFIERLERETTLQGATRVWKNGDADILLPSPDNDVIFVFTHILQHFFRGGIGLRQICDWCRLLWTYQETIDRNLLESRLKEMDLMSEWKAFAALAVDYLGMPIEAMPLYDRSRRWARKGYLILRFVLDVGNFGHNRDASFYQKYPYVIYKAISLGRHIGDFFRHFAIFPLDSLRVFCGTLTGGVEAVAKGK